MLENYQKISSLIVEFPITASRLFYNTVSETNQVLLMGANCVACRRDLDPKDKTFEQRLIEDMDFCKRCFREIMDSELDDFEIVLPRV